MSERTRILHASAFAVAMVAAMSDADAATLVDCRFNGGNGDNLSRAFYVTDYRGVTVDRVTLGHRASAVAGDRTIVLTMRLNTYNGPRPSARSPAGIPGGRSHHADDLQLRGHPGDARLAARLHAGSHPGRRPGELRRRRGAATTSPRRTDRRRRQLPPQHGRRDDGSPADLTDVVTFSCPYNPEGAGDGIERGFYVTRYPGKSMRRVSLRLRTSTPGGKTLLLTARSGAYDGPELGSEASSC